MPGSDRAEFPNRRARARGRDRAIQSLQPAFAIDHRTALLRETERGQNDRRQRRRFVRQNIHDDKGGSAASCSAVIPMLERIFAQRDERLDLAGRDAFGNLVQSFSPGSTR